MAEVRGGEELLHCVIKWLNNKLDEVGCIFEFVGLRAVHKDGRDHTTGRFFVSLGKELFIDAIIPLASNRPLFCYIGCVGEVGKWMVVSD